jgi:hypothetical protein
MSGLKPIGSEKLTGQDKINRIMEIARFKETIPQTINETAKSEYSISLADGNNYQIVRERQGYIIKKTITESETDYIEPMKNRKYYSSYSQAFKRLNLLAGELNRINENEEGLSLYGEQKKFTLKTPKPATPAIEAPAPPAEPPAVPSPELPPSPMDGGEDMGMDDMGMESPEGEDMGMDTEVEDIDVEVDGDNESQVTFKSIQKLTGKLTQKIRTLESQEGMTSEDIKYVINMVLSSFDLNSLSEEDTEDILSKFEEDTEDLGGDDMDGEDMTDDSEVEDIQADMDLPIEGEMDEEMYGSFGNMRRKDFRGDNYYDENDRPAKDFDIMGIGGDDNFDTEEFETYQQLYDKYGDKQKWFGGTSGERMFNLYKEKTGRPFKVKTRKSEMDEDDSYDYDNEEFDEYKWLFSKRGDDDDFEDTFESEWLDSLNNQMSGEDYEFELNRKNRKDNEHPLKINPRKSISKDNQGNGAIFDGIFGESKVDKVISKYFEHTKKEIRESQEKQIEKTLRKKTQVKQIMDSVVKMTETVEQELSAEKFLKENTGCNFVGKTNKKNLVFETKKGQIKITPTGEII